MAHAEDQNVGTFDPIDHHVRPVPMYPYRRCDLKTLACHLGIGGQKFDEFKQPVVISARLIKAKLGDAYGRNGCDIFLGFLRQAKSHHSPA